MIIMTVIGSVGGFARFYYNYENRMAQHDEALASQLGGRGQSVEQENAA